MSLLIEQANRNMYRPAYALISADRGKWHVSNCEDGRIRLTEYVDGKPSVHTFPRRLEGVVFEVH